ncbi:16S rRNA (uracil(1498)-N(3))-methyltransferase, partial [hydrothermal vent metagenome]
DVPTVAAPVKLAQMLDDWPTEQQLAFCDEAGDDEDAEWGGRHGRAAPALEALKTTNSKAHKGAVLTGPEGGFSFAERKRIRAMAFVTPITLGPRILRADTAALAALVLWQAALGDWRRP